MSTAEQQIASGLMEDDTGTFAICIDPKSAYNGMMVTKSGDGWKVSRTASAQQLADARKHMEYLKNPTLVVPPSMPMPPPTAG